MRAFTTSVIAALFLAACGNADDSQSGSESTGESRDSALTSTIDMIVSNNGFGQEATYSKAGSFDFNNPFFQSLGTNGRSCATCHDKNHAWTITPEFVRERFNATAGTDPLFRLVDGSNSPLAKVTTVADREAAYSMLLNKGLIRVGIPMPANADFDLIAVDDPYHFASARELSLFRRPLPTSNVKFLTAVMWDGRITGPFTAAALTAQADIATKGHAETATTLTETQRNQIFGFEVGLFTAQIVDNAAGPLYASGGLGGPRYLSSQPFWFGINDVLGADPSRRPFTTSVVTLYNAWTSSANAAQRAVARGQALFNAKPFVLRNVRGVNDALGMPALNATCTTCHDTPNVGNHSLPLPLDLGLGDETRRTPDMPLYTFRHKTTLQIIKTTDPGRALITGKFADMNKFKGAILRALAGRAPYFHGGSAATLLDAVNFYDSRFQIGFTAAEKADLVAFLKTL